MLELTEFHNQLYRALTVHLNTPKDYQQKRTAINAKAERQIVNKYNRWLLVTILNTNFYYSIFTIFIYHHTVRAYGVLRPTLSSFVSTPQYS